jgi:hypothetical protein
MGKNLDLVLAVLPRGWSQGQILAQLLARAEYTFGAVLYIKTCVLNIIITTDLILKNLKKIKYVYSPMSFNISF